MEVRKLQTTAAGTFVITIPKSWAEKLKLKKGDLVSVELDQGGITMTPTRSKPVSSQARSLRIEDFKDQKLLELCISASYLQGHDVTEIISKDKMLPDQKKWVRNAVEGLIGVEIAEDYANRIVLQNLVDPSKFDLNRMLERFSETSKAVLQDSIKALIERDYALAQDANERGEENTKFYRLLMRLALLGIRNKKIREEMNIGDFSTVAVKLIAIRELGRMAYYSMRIAQHAGEAEEARVEEETLSLIQRMGRITMEMQDEALKALLAKDLTLASSVIDRMSSVRKLYEGAFALLMKQDNEKSSFALSLIIRDIRAIAGYAVALADDAVLGIFA